MKEREDGKGGEREVPLTDSFLKWLHGQDWALTMPGGPRSSPTFALKISSSASLGASAGS